MLEVLCNGLVLCFLCSLTHAELLACKLCAQFCAGCRLTESLCLSGSLCFLCRQLVLQVLLNRLILHLLTGLCLRKVLRNGLVLRLLRLLLRAKRCKLRLSAKLARLQSLLERLLLRLILRGLRSKRLLHVLAEADVVQPRLFHARPKALQLRLIGKHGAGLLFGKPLLTSGLVKADALRSGLQ